MLEPAASAARPAAAEQTRTENSGNVKTVDCEMIENQLVNEKNMDKTNY